MGELTELLSAAGVLFAAAAVCIGSITMVSDGVPLLNQNTYRATVRNLEAVEDQYLVFTELEDGQRKVFQNEDNFLAGKMNSSDVYNELEIGEEYCFDTAGWRVPLFSWYENILRYEPVGPDGTCN